MEMLIINTPWNWKYNQNFDWLEWSLEKIFLWNILNVSISCVSSLFSRLYRWETAKPACTDHLLQPSRGNIHIFLFRVLKSLWFLSCYSETRRRINGLSLTHPLAEALIIRFLSFVCDATEERHTIALHFSCFLSSCISCDSKRRTHLSLSLSLESPLNLIHILHISSLVSSSFLFFFKSEEATGSTITCIFRLPPTFVSFSWSLSSIFGNELEYLKNHAVVTSKTLEVTVSQETCFVAATSIQKWTCLPFSKILNKFGPTVSVEKERERNTSCSSISESLNRNLAKYKCKYEFSSLVSPEETKSSWKDTEAVNIEINIGRKFLRKTSSQNWATKMTISFVQRPLFVFSFSCCSRCVSNVHGLFLEASFLHFVKNEDSLYENDHEDDVVFASDNSSVVVFLRHKPRILRKRPPADETSETKSVRLSCCDTDIKLLIFLCPTLIS